MDPSKIVDLLINGGPAAAGVILIWLAAPKASESYKNADAATKPMLRFAEPACWLTGLAMILWSVFLFVGHSEQVVAGNISSLSGAQSLWPRGDDLKFYLSKSNRPAPDPKTVDWVLVGSKMKDGKKIQLSINDRNGPDSLFEMEMLSEFYDGNDVNLAVDFAGKKVTLTHGKTSKTLALNRNEPLLDPPQAGSSTSRSFFSLPVIHAASTSTASPAETIRLLEMDDPAIRKNARDSALKSGKQFELPVIESVAKNPNRTYRSWVGALTILNQDTSIQPAELDPAVLGAMIDSLVTPGTDPTILGQIKGYMIAHTTPAMETALRAEFEKKTAAKVKPSDIYELTDTFFGVLYNVGVGERNQYKGPDAQSQAHFNASIAKFSDAWNLRPWAATWHVAQYPKALYGWASTLKAKADSDAKAHGSSDKKETDTARDKFAQFLKEANPSTYPAKYAGHIAEAKTYISQHP
jgi:hypothetical protein